MIFANIRTYRRYLVGISQNFQWYADIPVIGDIPFAILLLVGMAYSLPSGQKPFSFGSLAEG